LIINPAEIFPNVTDQKTFFIKENGFTKRYVIFVQIILSCKNARTQPNEFCDANQILKKPNFWNLALKKSIWQHCSPTGLPHQRYLSQAWDRGWLPQVWGAHRPYLTRYETH
jgi:hypothetical protein